MSRTWTLTDLEFVVSWEGTGEGILPEPLFFISGTRSLADAEREKRVTAERLRALGADPPLTLSDRRRSTPIRNSLRSRNGCAAVTRFAVY